MGAKNITTPIIAIGGIEVNDVKSVINTGVQGIAISSAIINAENWKEQVASFQNELTTTKEKSNVANS